MKIALRKSRGLLCAGIAIALCCGQSTLAGEHRRNVSSEIDQSRTNITSSEIFLVEHGATFMVNLKEVDVVRMGCHYSVTNMYDLNGLIDELVDAQISEIPPLKDGYDARLVVYLYHGKEVLEKLVLSPDYKNANAKGEFFGPGGAIPVQASKRIEERLRIWEQQHPSLAIEHC